MIPHLILILLAVLPASWCWTFEIYPRPIESVLEMDSFYTKVLQPMGFAKIIKCEALNWATIKWVIGTSCGCGCIDLLALHVLMQRHLPDKGIFYMFGTECSRQPKQLSSLLPVFDNPHTFYGMQVANGPGIKLNLTAANPFYYYHGPENQPFNNSAKTVLMFAHQKDSMAGYTQANVKEMRQAYSKNSKLPAQVYVGFEVGRLAGLEDGIDLAKEFKGVDVLIYRDSKQPFVEYLEPLRKVLLPFWELEDPNLSYFLAEEERVLLFAYLPKANWMQFKFKNQGTFNSPNMIDFQEFIYGGRSQILVKATDCAEYDDEDFSVTSLCNLPHNVYANHLFSIADCRMTIGVQFSDPRDVGRIAYDHFLRTPFIVLELVVGPNGNKTAVASLQHVDTKLPIHLVIGFVENTGKRKYYDDKDATALAKVIESDKFKSVFFGVRMSSAFLAHKYITHHFKSLMNCTKFKYLFVTDTKNDTFLPDDAVKALKYNIKMFDRETFLLVEDPLRTRIYKNEEIGGYLPPPTPRPVPTGPTFTIPTLAPGDLFTQFPTITPLPLPESGAVLRLRLSPWVAGVVIVAIMGRLINECTG